MNCGNVISSNLIMPLTCGALVLMGDVATSLVSPLSRGELSSRKMACACHTLEGGAPPRMCREVTSTRCSLN